MVDLQRLAEQILDFFHKEDERRGRLNIHIATLYKAFEKEQSAEDRATYARAEGDARSARRGLWREPGAIAPWDFRKAKRNQ